MAKGMQWTCPFCNRPATIQAGDYTYRDMRFGFDDERTKLDDAGMIIRAIACPNPVCLEITLRVELVQFEWLEDEWQLKNVIHSWQLLPESEAKPQPDYIPAPIVENYNEACRIRDLSPKASATLSRRCLQGMIRDFWKTPKKRDLWAEIQAIEDMIDTSTWEAIDAVRKVGKIGAHMEQDVNIVIDVEPKEAQLLIGLIEMLFEDWYVAQYEKEQRIARVIALGADKEHQTKAAKKPAADEAAEEAADEG